MTNIGGFNVHVFAFIWLDFIFSGKHQRSQDTTKKRERVSKTMRDMNPVNSIPSY